MPDISGLISIFIFTTEHQVKTSPICIRTKQMPKSDVQAKQIK